MMKKRSILVTAIGGDIGQSVLKCLKDNGEEYDFHIIGADMDKYAAGRGLVDEFYQSPSAADTKEYLQFVMSILLDKKPDYTVFISEPEIRVFNENRSAYANSSTKFLANDQNITDLFMDKYNTVLFLKDNRLPYPETYLVSEYRGQLDFPLILKSRVGYGGRGIVKVASEPELRSYVNIYRDNCIIQEYLPGNDQEYTLGLFRCGKDIHSIAFKRQLGYGSLTKSAEYIADHDLDALARKIAVACNLTGSINVQLRKTDAGYIPFEINPRFSSTVYLRHFFGFKDVVWWVGLIERSPIIYSPKYSKGVGVRNISEVFFDLQENGDNV